MKEEAEATEADEEGKGIAAIGPRLASHKGGLDVVDEWEGQHELWPTHRRPMRGVASRAGRGALEGRADVGPGRVGEGAVRVSRMLRGEGVNVMAEQEKRHKRGGIFVAGVAMAICCGGGCAGVRERLALVTGLGRRAPRVEVLKSGLLSACSAGGTWRRLTRRCAARLRRRWMSRSNSLPSYAIHHPPPTYMLGCKVATAVTTTTTTIPTHAKTRCPTGSSPVERRGMREDKRIPRLSAVEFDGDIPPVEKRMQLNLRLKESVRGSLATNT
jgi:hypothetical protein